MNEKRIESALNQAVQYRNYRRARERSLTRLAQAYPEHYKELLEQEKAIDEQQGKKWIDINGTTSLSADAPTQRTDRGETSRHTGENEGDNGGEA